MTTIRKGINKGFWCSIGLHKWNDWKCHNIFTSCIIDYEKRCLKCGMIKRITVDKEVKDYE